MVSVQGLDMLSAGLPGTTCSACDGFVGLKWGVLGPWLGFQAVDKRQLAEQITRTAIDLTFIPLPER